MQKKNILLIDDDYVFNFVAKIMLEKTEKVESISIALNGMEAVHELRECSAGVRPYPDVIFLDINMPIMNGFEFMEAFNEMDLPEKEKIHLIMVTSSLDPHDIEKASMLGVKKYLSKPLTESDIQSALNN